MNEDLFAIGGGGGVDLWNRPKPHSKERENELPSWCPASKGATPVFCISSVEWNVLGKSNGIFLTDRYWYGCKKKKIWSLIYFVGVGFVKSKRSVHFLKRKPLFDLLQRINCVGPFQMTLKGFFSCPVFSLTASCVFWGHTINILYDVQMSY